MGGPRLSVLVSSFERPQHLLRVLWSIARQRLPAGWSEEHVEVVISDDGSRDDTFARARGFAQQVRFPVIWTTHPHDGFQLARCRNEAVAVSSAPYLLFLDGDCLLPQGHLAAHWIRRRPGWVQAGYCGLLSREQSASLSERDIQSERHTCMLSRTERRKLRRMHRKAEWYRRLRHPSKPKIYGGNVGIFRCDYRCVNGYDEAFRGWGCEDDDLRVRLRRCGMRVRSILDRTYTMHLWHPPVPSAPGRWADGANVARLRSSGRPAYCRRGVSQYLCEGKPIHWIPLNPHAAQRDLPNRCRAESPVCG